MRTQHPRTQHPRTQQPRAPRPLPARPATRDRRGFALAMAILVISVLTLLVLGAFSMTRTELRVNEDNRAEVRALTMAQTSLDNYIFARNSMMIQTDSGIKYNRAQVRASTVLPPGSQGKEYARVKLTDPVYNVEVGYADVTMRPLRPADLYNKIPALMVIIAHAVDTTRALAGTPYAEHTVAKYAEWRPQSMNVLAGWSALTGIKVNGGAASVSGIDYCGKADTVAGAAIPATAAALGNQLGSVLTGDPKVDTVAPDPATMAKQMNIDWPGIISGKTLQATYVLPSGGPLTASMFADTTAWPIVLVNGDLSMNYTFTGRGTLIVTGNLTIQGSRQWDGIVLVGGTLSSNGDNSIFGATVTGLNVLTNPSNPPSYSSIANGVKTFQYHSCNVEKAANSLSALAPYQNAWTNNWAF